MSKRVYIQRYMLIIKKLQISGRATSEEINHFLTEQSELNDYDFTVSRRTLQRDLDEIRSIFDIDISFNFKTKTYELKEDEVHRSSNLRLVEALDIHYALNIAGKLSPYVFLENRQPQGTEHIHGLLHAIQNRWLVKFTHQPFWASESTKRLVAPYALKEFKNRWYVLASDSKDELIKTFGLDRLSDLEITKKHFTNPKDFQVNEYFRYCFGIIAPSGKEPQEIILSFDPEQGKYIKSLKLHDHQQTLVDNEDEFRIRLKLCITHDFIMELLSHGDTVRVIEPDELKVELHRIYTNALIQN